MRITKQCIACGADYLTNFYSERSKYCSRLCLTTHKKKLHKLKLREERKALTKVRFHKRVLAKRVEQLEHITMKNRNTLLEHLGNGTYKYADSILTLKNYKEPLKAIPKSEGIGYYGTLASDIITGQVQCHICGSFLDAMAGHIRHINTLAHGKKLLKCAILMRYISRNW